MRVSELAVDGKFFRKKSDKLGGRFRVEKKPAFLKLQPAPAVKIVNLIARVDLRRRHASLCVWVNVNGSFGCEILQKSNIA